MIHCIVLLDRNHKTIRNCSRRTALVVFKSERTSCCIPSNNIPADPRNKWAAKSKLRRNGPVISLLQSLPTVTTTCETEKLYSKYTSEAFERESDDLYDSKVFQFYGVLFVLSVCQTIHFTSKGAKIVHRSLAQLKKSYSLLTYFVKVNKPITAIASKLF